MSLMQDALRIMFVRAAAAFSERHYGTGWYVGLHNELRKASGTDPSWLLMAHACDGWPRRDLGIGPGSRMTVWEPLTWIERERAITLMLDHQAAHPDDYPKDDDQ